MNGSENKTYDEYPLKLVLFCAAVSFAIYIIGAYLIAPLGKVYAAAYILYCCWMELRGLTASCRGCYYHGRMCAFGKGRICSLLFKNGSPERFRNRKISWMNLIPDFMVALIPLAAGGVLLVQSFSWLRLSFVTALAIIAFPLTGFVRGSIACKFCRQKEMGCPAIQFFTRNGKNP